MNKKMAKFCKRSFLASLLIHIGFLVLLAQAPVDEGGGVEGEDTEVIFVEYPPHRQIVNQKNFNKISPQTKRTYLSQADQSVERETQAMLKGLFHQASSSATFIPQHKVSRKPSSKSRASQALPRDSRLTEWRIKDMPLRMELGEGDFSSQNPFSRSQTMDFLPGVELGSHTMLNTKEFRYYSYFSRMKEQLYWRWTSLFKESAVPLSSQIKRAYQRRLFHTSLYVYLSPDGEIQDISVVKSSGLESIDSIALYAFMESAPFPNPPEGLVEEDGYIHIRQSFNLYIQPALLK